MNDEAQLKLALEKLNVSIKAIIKVIGTGRNIHGAAFDMNNMLTAKANIEKLLAAIPTLKVVKSKNK
jgi:hypothetical protein